MFGINNLVGLLANAQSYREDGERNVAELAKKLADPTQAAHALSWAGDAVQGAADVEVWGAVENWAKKAQNAVGEGRTTDADAMAVIKQEATAKLISAATDGTSRSTSVMSNLVTDCRRVAWARVVQKLSDI